MTERPRLSLMEHFGEVPDPRMARTQRHELLDILAIALCAVIGGADHWTEVVEFGQARLAWFATFLKLPNGIPSHDTFARVFRLINTEALEKACHQWLASLVGRVQGVVAIAFKKCAWLPRWGKTPAAYRQRLGQPSRHAARAGANG